VFAAWPNEQMDMVRRTADRDRGGSHVPKGATHVRMNPVAPGVSDSSLAVFGGKDDVAGQVEVGGRHPTRLRWTTFFPEDDCAKRESAAAQAGIEPPFHQVGQCV